MNPLRAVLLLGSVAFVAAAIPGALRFQSSDPTSKLPCDENGIQLVKPVECAAADEPHGEALQPADRALRSRLNDAMLALEREGRLAPFTNVPQVEDATLPELPQPRPSDVPLDCEEWYDLLGKATVMIHTGYKCDRCANWHGGVATGFVIHPDGWIITAGHVLKDLEANRHLAIMLHDQSIYPIESVALVDADADLALVKVAATELPFLPLARELPSPGTEVSVMSHPNGHFFILTRGVISRILDDSGPSRERLQITAPFAIGSSGAPVIDDCGNVVGMALSTETIYADPEEQKNPQLVIPSCTPADAIRAAIEKN